VEFAERLVRWFASPNSKAAIKSTGRLHGWEPELFGDEIGIDDLAKIFNSTSRNITKLARASTDEPTAGSGSGVLRRSKGSHDKHPSQTCAEYRRLTPLQLRYAPRH